MLSKEGGLARNSTSSRSRRLGINARILVEETAGVKRYAQCLLEQWGKMHLPFESVALYSHQPLERSLLPAGFYNQVIKSKLPNVLWENVLLPAKARDSGVLFCPSYTVPMWYRGKRVVTIHDATQEIVPKSYAIPWYVRLRWSWAYRYSAKKADVVITVCHATKQDISRYYKVDEGKIRVTYLAANEMFRPVGDEAELNRVREKYHLGGRPFLMFAGQLTGRRRVPEVIEALSQLEKQYKVPHKLLIVGRNRSNRDPMDVAREVGIADSVAHLGWISDQDLVSLYNAADVFVSPADYDGFALPPLEAMSCGAPVITTNVGGLKEIYGGAAFMLESNSVNEIKEAILAVTSDRALRDKLIKDGLERAKAFSWEKTAKETMEILQQVAEGKDRPS